MKQRLSIIALQGETSYILIDPIRPFLAIFVAEVQNEVSIVFM